MKRKWIAALTLMMSLNGIAPAIAQVPSMVPVSSDQATEQTETLLLYPGRQSLIDFQNGQVIYFIQLADVSEVVYSTDMSIESGQARTILLRPIERLNLEHAILSASDDSPTNLSVGTIGPLGRQLYTFNVRLAQEANGVHSNGIVVGPSIPAAADGTLVLQTGQIATLEDVQQGVVAVVAQRYVGASDPVVAQLQNVLVLVRNGLSWSQAAQQSGVSLAVVERIAEIGVSVSTPTPPMSIAPAPHVLTN